MINCFEFISDLGRIVGIKTENAINHTCHNRIETCSTIYVHTFLGISWKRICSYWYFTPCFFMPESWLKLYDVQNTFFFSMIIEWPVWALCSIRDTDIMQIIRGGFTWNTLKISRAPPKIEKIWFFGVNSWFFTRNTLKMFVPPSARRNFFKCAPPNLKSWIRPW